jgi:predicted AlkP superfamily pyrophosphatase or phosphodiesterase
MIPLVFPDYNNSLLNLVNSILKYYNVDLGYNGLKSLNNILKKDYKNVIFFLIDGLGLEIIKNHHETCIFLNESITDEITSVFPSTTVAATTTAITGLPPITTGWIGWQQYFKEENRNVVLFLNKDYYDEEYEFNYNISEKYIKTTNIYELISRANPQIRTHEVFPEFKTKEHDSIDSQVNSIKKICDSCEENFIYAYWDKLDVLLHEHGVGSLEVKNHLFEIEEAIKKLKDDLDEDSLIILTADHGQIDIEGIELWNYDDIISLLKQKPAIESRATAFYIKDGFDELFEETFNKHFYGKFILYKTEDLIKTGLFGKGEIHPKVSEFLGDYFAIAIDKYSFRLQEAKHTHKATHAGLTKSEMMIPLITFTGRNK